MRAPSPRMREPRDVLRSLGNALTILEAFDLDHPELGVSDLARRLGLAPSTVHRLLNSLAAHRFVESTERRTYRLGLRAIEVGALALQHRGFGEAIQPALEEVSRATNETVNVAILDGDEIVYVAVLESKAVLRPYFAVGQRGPAALTALGKALLAWGTDEATWPEERRAELERIQREGVAYDLEDSEPGVRCLAVPIMGRHGRPVAAISVAGPAARLTRKAMRSAISPLRLASETIAGTISLRGAERSPRQRER
ncbi:MAG: IclR family transcriptional regulator [Gaiellaceae bacterium]